MNGFVLLLPAPHVQAPCPLGDRYQHLAGFELDQWLRFRRFSENTGGLMFREHTLTKTDKFNTENLRFCKKQKIYSTFVLALEYLIELPLLFSLREKEIYLIRLI